ncbi:lysophospholipid acyltransferase family protein [Candidatus Methylacidithermus pantelleriae]|nr:lysophospholipid acyltransferase family protein [Candidatus Methylacidithermus pantelleriae]
MAILVQGVAKTVVYDLHDPAGLIAHPPNSSLIFAFWHNRFFLLPYLYRQFLPGRKLAVLISHSNDGQYLSRLLTQFSVLPIRGSTSRKASSGFRAMVRLAQRGGWDLGIAPDGPRGPRYSIQKGILQLSQLTGLAIVPVTYHLTRKLELRSWDRFQVPLPFSYCRLCIGAPFSVPYDASEKELQVYQERLRVELGS